MIDKQFEKEEFKKSVKENVKFLYRKTLEEATQEQHDVLCQCLPIGQYQCLTEAAAVGHGIFQINPNRQRSHRRHEEEREARGQFAAYAE